MKGTIHIYIPYPEGPVADELKGMADRWKGPERSVRIHFAGKGTLSEVPSHEAIYLTAHGMGCANEFISSGRTDVKLHYNDVCAGLMEDGLNHHTKLKLYLCRAGDDMQTFARGVYDFLKPKPAYAALKIFAYRGSVTPYHDYRHKRSNHGTGYYTRAKHDRIEVGPPPEDLTEYESMPC